ncbi:MAG: endonuclease III [Clostridiales bacterium]|nr:endonuclease III [Clostridiales bacterium]
MKKKDVIQVIEILKKYYPEATCSLDFKTPFQMVVAVMLSAQCTDERVNKTTPKLFEKYGTPEAILNMDLKELEEIIHPCGFYKNKAKNIKSTAEKIIKDYNGEVPNIIEELLKLPGIGRKSANVIMLEVFNMPQGIAIDTHAKRISNKLGLSKEVDPYKIEMDLLKIIPEEYFYDVNHLLMWHGRNICIAKKPKCEICPINIYCKSWKGKKLNEFE